MAHRVAAAVKAGQHHEERKERSHRAMAERLDVMPVRCGRDRETSPQTGRVGWGQKETSLRERGAGRDQVVSCVT
eukprot:6184594-Pleurochrysis_carterae.AAC.1